MCCVVFCCVVACLEDEALDAHDVTNVDGSKNVLAHVVPAHLSERLSHRIVSWFITRLCYCVYDKVNSGGDCGSGHIETGSRITTRTSALSSWMKKEKFIGYTPVWAVNTGCDACFVARSRDLSRHWTWHSG